MTCSALLIVTGAVFEAVGLALLIYEQRRLSTRVLGRPTIGERASETLKRLSRRPARSSVRATFAISTPVEAPPKRPQLRDADTVDGRLEAIEGYLRQIAEYDEGYLTATVGSLQSLYHRATEFEDRLAGQAEDRRRELARSVQLQLASAVFIAAGLVVGTWGNLVA